MTQITTHFGPGQRRRKNRRRRHLAWYANRLRAMDPQEIGHRIIEQLKRRSAAYRAYGWASFDAGEGAVPRLPVLSAPEIRHRRRLIAQWRNIADAAMSTGLNLLGRGWPLVRDARAWHLDPVSRRIWPQKPFCFDVTHRGDTELGDVKFVWELNRLQFLQPIAALGALDDRPDLVTFCLRQIESWIDANPPFRGINWASGIELALRSISILTVLSFVDDRAVEPRLRRKLRTCLNAHAYWLLRFPSQYSSANNHLVAEASALYLIGTLIPDLDLAARGVAYARTTLVEQVERQFHEDGVGAEQSPTYTCFTIELYLLAVWLGDRTGNPFPKTVKRRLGRAAEHLRWMTDTGGNQPRIGDDDDGRVLCSQAQPEAQYVSSILASLAAYLERPDLAPPAPAPHLRNLVFGPPPRARALDGMRSFDAGGYTVVRTTLSGRDALVALDHGALGHLSIAAHGHADALSLWLHLDGQPVLVDAGTFLYHSGLEWRDHFRSTAAHNTLSIAGTSSSSISGPFNWNRKARAWREKSVNTAHERRIVAAHDGYVRSFGVTHRREVTINTSRITIVDSLADGRVKIPSVEIGYLFHPDLNVTLEGGAARISRDDRDLLYMIPGPSLNASLHRGEVSPMRGWYAPRFGEKRPATMILLRADLTETRWSTELVIAKPDARSEADDGLAGVR